MILEPMTKQDLEDIFDKTALEVIEFYIQKASIAQPELLQGQQPKALQVPKEHIEQWILQAIGGIPVGAGSYPVDIVKDDIGIDVKMLSAKCNKDGNLSDADSGETSLAQKFRDTGVGLDALFANKQYVTIVDGWKNILESKLVGVMQEQTLSKIYYIFILRGESKIYLCATKVNVSEIQSLSYDKATDSSVFVGNLIDSNFGYGKIYKAKKRLELRLKPKHWVENGYTIDFNINIKLQAKNIRNLIEINEISNYKKELYSQLVGE